MGTPTRLSGPSGSSAAAARSHSLPSLRNSAATAAPSAVEAAAVRQAIEQANAKQRNAINRGVGTGLVANYADDAVLMCPGEPAWRGRGEIGANGVKLLHSAKFGDMKLNTASVDVAGDYAIETGSVEWTVHWPSSLSRRTWHGRGSASNRRRHFALGRCR